MKSCFLFLCPSLLFLFSSCGKSPSAKDINPNGSSELAILMREMYDDGMVVKQKVLAGEHANVSCEYARIHSATPTEASKTANPSYVAFAKSYEDAVSAFNQATPFQQKSAYQHMVKSCIDCHQQICPGPVRRIKKLTIED